MDEFGVKFLSVQEVIVMSKKSGRKSQYRVDQPVVLTKKYIKFDVDVVLFVVDPIKKGKEHSIEVRDVTNNKDRVPSKYLKPLEK